MTQHADYKNQKTLWIVILVTFILTAFIYMVFGYLVHRSKGIASPTPVANTLLPYLHITAVVVMVLGVVVMKRAVRGVGSGNYLSSDRSLILTPNQFFRQTILALILCEAAPLIGIAILFVSGRLTEVLFFSAAAIAIYAIYYLPQGIRYWTEVTAE